MEEVERSWCPAHQVVLGQHRQGGEMKGEGGAGTGGGGAHSAEV